MTGKLRGLHYHLEGDYSRVFDKVARRRADGSWAYFIEKALFSVKPDGVSGGIHTALDIDRKSGRLAQLAGILLDPQFTLLMLQQGVLMPEMFVGASEGPDWIDLSTRQFGDIACSVKIVRDLDVSMRTVDAQGIPL